MHAHHGSRIRLAVGVLGAALVAALAWSARASVGAALTALGTASPAYLLLAVAAEAASMAGLARQQRRLVGPAPERLAPLASVLRTTYAGNAISVSLPLAGSAISTGYTFRRYTARGAPPGQVASGLAVSGVVSTAAFAVVLTAAASWSGQPALVVAGVAGGLLSLALLVVVLVAVHSPRLRVPAERVAAWALGIVQRVVHRPAGAPSQLVTSALDQLAAARLPRRDLAVALCLAVLNWSADIACLGFALAALGAHLPWPALVLSWGAGAGVSSLNLTPGSVGVAEAALAAALTGAGLPAVTGLAAALIYRVVSFWFVLAVGGLALTLHRRRPSSPPSPPSPSGMG